MKKQILQMIEEHSIITVFRHGHPDHDALGSQFGLRQFILDNFPNKQVFCLGDERMKHHYYPDSDVVSDEIIQNSLAIVVDTAGINRVDDARFMKAQAKIRIDHHPQQDEGYDLQYVVATAGACSEILADVMQSYNKLVSDQTSEYLLRGIIADTLGFQTSNTTANTLRMAAFLAERQVSLPEINRLVFDVSQKTFEFATELRKRVMVDQGIASVILSYEDCQDLGISSRQAKELVSQFGGVKEFQAWCVFAENEQHQYEGSLRSKTLVMNDIASQFHGGGHQNACGVRELSLNDVYALIQALKERLSDQE